MSIQAERTGTFPVGIDLGTTYSSLAYLTPQGQPVTMPNAEGELSTPSVVLFEGDDVIVGTEALRHSVASPERVVQYAKRHMGDPHKCWVIDGKVYRPRDISSLILKKLLKDAREQLGTIRHAVITVPAQFSELQRRDTVEAGLAAGLERVDIIHEPVAAALCYVLGEGMWFAELANEQTVLVFDLGGGTFDLSLVKYNKKEVRVLASGGDLLLGGLDWNHALETYACDEFIKSSISDPRLDRESMQALAIEVEQTKRSLSVRPKSSLLVQHDGRRKSYSIDRDLFEDLTAPLLQRTEQIMRDLLKSNKLGWANIDAILATGGSSRMPMIRNMLQRVGGTTLNQTLSPDQSICHGAAYYAGMLHSGQRLEKTVLDRHAVGRLANFKQQSVSGRSLGILVRDMKTNVRRAHYLLPANTPLPCAYRQRFGTVIPNQKKVHLHIVESGTSPADPWVELGECIIEGLPDKLPVTSPIEVTIRYDEQARVHVEAIAVSSGLSAQTTLVRPTQTLSAVAPAVPQPIANPSVRKTATPVSPPSGKAGAAAPRLAAASSLDDSEQPIPLCNNCGEALNVKGQCPACSVRQHRPGAAPRKRLADPRQRPVKAGEDAQPTERLEAQLPPPPKPAAKARKKP
ncbi:Hsp70 family protein [Planctomicrobium sp. SH661]|uniref:Hsp70 family protein n=1 Tax=Planctomicrobium sp. SH661 TaxID=3448124 RepID=UPI003F5AE61F